MTDYFTGLRRPADPAKATPRVVGNHPDCAETKRCRAELEAAYLQVYESTLGSMQRVPNVLISPSEIQTCSLDQRAAYIVSQIDGVVTYSDILSISSMSKLDTCRILVQLLQDGIIG